jgi:NAD(P)-dependent dehydrogenase (short-subunit alcohol dehydrogenase family)
VGGVLDGKVALVTGASRGIGARIAAHFAAQGARVAVTARTVDTTDQRLPGTIGDTVDGIVAAGGAAAAFQADLSRPEERERLVTDVVAAFDRVDVLVNNAAVTYFTPVREFGARRFALMFEVQVTASVHLAQLVAPGMVERGSGWILNISSGAARHPNFPPTQRAARGGTVYGMCKAAIERFSTGLAAELYADGVAVNALSPTKVVPTPGTLFHHLTTQDDPNAEPPDVMAAAALALCHAPATELTGRVAYSQSLLTELGLPVPTE